MYAYEFLARIEAGLILAGRFAGSYEWMGTRQQWQDSEATIAAIEESDDLVALDHYRDEVCF